MALRLSEQNVTNDTALAVPARLVLRSGTDDMSPTTDQARILIADDLPENRLVYESVLSTLGENLVLVSSGAQALKQVLNHQFAVILLDVNMPDMSGFETARLIRGHRRSSTTPIIFLTAFADEVRTAEGYASGAVDYLPTPIVPEILRAKVRVFVELFKMRRQVAQQAEDRARRDAAEEANRQLKFLADAGAVLGRSLDFLATARDLVRLTVPFLADTCLLSIAPSIVAGETYFFAERTAATEPRLRELTSRADLPAGFQLVSEAAFRQELQSEGPRAPDLIHHEGTSYLSIPLEARGRRFAVLTIARAEADGGLTESEATLAVALGSRAAMALDNAVLHEEILKADRQKLDFLSMLAHELRNPLAPICNAVQLMRHNPLNGADLQWVGSVIDRQANQLVRLVDDLLDISRITSGKIRLNFQVMDVMRAVHQAVEASQPLIESRNHHLLLAAPTDPVWIHGDLARMTQVLTNLLNNAAKYSDDGGQIQLCVQVEGSRCILSVRDSGIGIAPEMLKSVFDLFTQAEQTLDRSQGGLGIGLTMVRKLVEMHEGSVAAESGGIGHGSAFHVSLPICGSVETTADPPAEMFLDSQNQRHLEILVVDDNADAADTLATLLQRAGHRVRVAYDGLAAVEMANSLAPELVFLDIGLPGLDGYEVAARLRRADSTRNAVLIATTGYSQSRDAARSRQAGFDLHLVKPVRLHSLREILRSEQVTVSTE